MIPAQQKDQTGSNPDYYPYRLGQAGTGDPKKFAFLISGRDERRQAGQNQVLSIFLKHRAKILSQWGYTDDPRHEFVICLTCDIRGADITSDGLIVELRLLKFVTAARSVRMENRLFDGFSFPLALLDNRIIALDASITFLLERELKFPEQKAMLTEVGRVYAVDVVRQVRSKLSGSSPEKVIVDNALEFLKVAGLGRFSLVDGDGNTIQAIVRDPPLSEKGDARGNHFIHGIVIGLIEAFRGRETVVVEDLYDPGANRLFVTLLDKNNVSTSAKLSQDPTKIRALEEVEKVISVIDRETKEATPVPLVNTSSATLNQVLKNYENEGWIGGKISYAEIPPETARPPVVVRYLEEQPKPLERRKEEVAPSAEAATKVLEKVEAELKTIPQTPPKAPEGKALKKIGKRLNGEEESELTKAIRKAMGEDDLYFEDSSFLE
jgi:hypothetical protein